jgi:hypothetical protein
VSRLRDALDRAELLDEVADTAIAEPSVHRPLAELLCAEAQAANAEVLDLLVGPCRAAGPLVQSHAPAAAVVVGRGPAARIIRHVDGRG